MPEPSDRQKPPAFFCPSCGQKHRADPAPLRKRGKEGAAVACRGCGARLRVFLDEKDQPACELVGPPPAAAAPKPEQPQTAKPKTAKPKAATPKAATPKAAKPRPAKPSPAKPVAPAAPPPSTEKPFAEGAKVGRYTVRGLLRRGGSSTVYRAHDPKTKRSVALKILNSDAPDAVRRRFLRQVHVQANIRHPNVMPVYDRGELEDGRPFFTMELVHRPVTLAEVLKRHHDGTLDDDAKLAPLADTRTVIEMVLLPIADGVYVANVENGVVHGDLKPENVVVDGRTLRPYLMDFGRSGALEDAGGVDTREDSPYLAPEQVRGEENPRTDVWGLGALCYVILAGRPPLDGHGEELRANATTATYAPLPADAPPAPAAVAQKAMSPEPEHRYVNARQLAADLRAWLKGGRVRALEEFGGPGATAEEKRAVLRRHLRAALWVVAGLLVGLLVGSRIRVGGEDPGEVRTAAAETDVTRLARFLDRLAPVAGRLPPADAWEIWSRLGVQADRIDARLAKTPPSSARKAVRDGLATVRGRLAPARVDVGVPEGVPVRFANADSGASWTPEAGPLRLPPGRWVVDVADSLAFEVRIPFAVRPARGVVEGEKPVASWSIPVDPREVPPERAMVVGRVVVVSEPPRSPKRAKVAVPTFLIDRHRVTNAAYARFLAAQPEAEREARVPNRGFTQNAAGAWEPEAGEESRPVLGVRPVDARAYCAWRSGVETATVRLPTEAEWMLAAGARRVPLGAGDLVPVTAQANPIAESLLAPPREMVTQETRDHASDGDASDGDASDGDASDGDASDGDAADDDAAEDVCAKGRRDADTSLVDACYDAERLDPDSRADDVGFRCVSALR